MRYLILLLLCLIGCGVSTPPVQTAEEKEEAAKAKERLTKYLADLIETGIITEVKADTYEVWFDGRIWRELNAQRKEETTRNIARAIGTINGGGSGRLVTIYDSHTAKKIASLGVGGFQVYFY